MHPLGSQSTVKHPGSHYPRHILQGVTLYGTFFRESLSMVHPPMSCSRRYILPGVTLHGASSKESLSTVHHQGSHSLRFCLRESLSTVLPPGFSLYRSSSRESLNFYGTSTEESLSTVQHPWSRYRWSNHRGAALDGPTIVRKIGKGMFIQKNNINPLDQSYNVCLSNTKILLCVHLCS